MLVHLKTGSFLLKVFSILGVFKGIQEPYSDGDWKSGRKSGS